MQNKHEFKMKNKIIKIYFTVKISLNPYDKINILLN
jgi:hypothetical protein